MDLSARSLVIGQLGQSLDGRVATLSGESKYISGSCALDHLHRLRAAVDAVLVGVGTVVADDPLLTVRRVEGRSPARVVIDPSGRVDPDARCLADDGARRFVVRTPAAGSTLPPGVEVLVVCPDAQGRIAPRAILSALAAAGLSRILVEGGPATLAAFIEAGLLDRLHVVVSPVILGSGRTGLDLTPIAGLGDALRPPACVTLFPDGDVLFDCDMRHGAREESHARQREDSLFGAG
ncbi:RibD family protein [Aquabacter cavernae]|uniref:RibD family protein n=1 Tax=Aquabacter cavernae TaxID=2496029 RepID=UPI001FE01425|nr:RibD family protein [Aquabacter cavernae]